MVQPFRPTKSASITTLIGMTAHHILDLAQWKNCSNHSFHGQPLHEATAKMSAAFVTSLFACPEFPPPSTSLTAPGQPVPSPKLANRVAYALHHTCLASCITFALHFILIGYYFAPSMAATAFRSKALQDNYDTDPQDASVVAKPTIPHKVLTHQHSQNAAESQEANETSTTVYRPLVMKKERWPITMSLQEILSWMQFEAKSNAKLTSASIDVVA